MAGTKAGGQKTAATNRAKYGSDYYSKMGSLGGKALTGKKGFALVSPEKRRAAGSLGGTVSRRNGTDPDPFEVSKKRAELKKVMDGKSTNPFFFRGKFWASK